MPPYAPYDADETNLDKYICDEKKLNRSDLNEVTVRDGSCSIVTILIEKGCKKIIFDKNKLKWHRHKEDRYEKHLTLKEIYLQLKAKGYKDIIYVWEETPLRGTIYMCGNYEEGQWVKHGVTRGFV